MKVKNKSKYHSVLGKKRWAKISAKKRSIMMSDMAKKRWAKGRKSILL